MHGFVFTTARPLLKKVTLLSNLVKPSEFKCLSLSDPTEVVSIDPFVFNSSIVSLVVEALICMQFVWKDHKDMIFEKRSITYLSQCIKQYVLAKSLIGEAKE